MSNNDADEAVSVVSLTSSSGGYINGRNYVNLKLNWFVMQGPVAIILISWSVIFIWEIGYWTRAIQRFALFDLLKSLYPDTKILSKKFMILKLKSYRLSYILVLIWPLSSNSRYKSKNDADEAVSVVSLSWPVAIILISWNVIFIWETGNWTRAIKRFALFDLLKSLYSDTNILSKYIPSLQEKL
jgi:hypothetical protein